MAAPHPLQGRAQKRARVDPAMLPESPVLVSDEHREIARIDVVGRRRQPPAAVRQGEGAQQPAVAVDDDGRSLARGRKVERAEARLVVLPGERRGDACGEDARAASGDDQRGG